MQSEQQAHPHWMTMSFLLMINLFPSLKLKLWRWLYNKIASLDSSGNFLFMNYGFHEEDNKYIELKPEDEPFRCAIQLYNHVTMDTVLQNKDVLEMGCGRGDGGSFFLRYNPRSFVGVDLSQTAIEWCQHQHAYHNARWLQGSAECIPMPDGSIDIVVNVESSHCYLSMANFLQEVKRIL